MWEKGDERMPKSEKGFSLIEVLVVLAVLGVLTAVLTPTFLGAREATRTKQDLATFKEIAANVQIAIQNSETYKEAYKIAEETTNWQLRFIYTKNGDNEIILKTCEADHKTQGMINSDGQSLESVKLSFIQTQVDNQVNGHLEKAEVQSKKYKALDEYVVQITLSDVYLKVDGKFVEPT